METTLSGGLFAAELFPLGTDSGRLRAIGPLYANFQRHFSNKTASLTLLVA
jgi:hypothetical protein